MGLLFEKLKARQKPDGTFTPAPAEDTPMLSGSSLNVPRPEYPDKVEVEPVSHTTIQPQTIYDIVSQYGRPRSYEKEVAEAERQKKLGMLSDILGLGVNLATGVAGRRIFDQPQSNTSIADARLQRLKDLQRADSVRFDNALLNARLQDYQNERAAAAAKANADWEKHKFDTNTKIKLADINRQIQKDAENARLRAEENKKTAEYREAMLKLQQQRIAASQNGKDKFDYLIGQNGRKTVIPKDEAAAVAGYLYNRMQEIIASNPNDRRTVEDVKMQMGEGGDQSNKTLSIVKRRIKDFPELQDEYESIMNGTYEPKDAQQTVYEYLQRFFPKQEYSGPYRPPEYLNGKEVVDFSPEQEVIKYKPKSK